MEKKKKFIKPGETREQKPQMGVTLGPDGKVRHYKSINERLIPVHRLQLRTNALVEITNGMHRRLYGRVVNYDEKGNDGKIQVLLNLSQEVVVISKESMEVLDEDAVPDDHPAFQIRKPSASSASKRSRSRSRSKSKSKSKSKSRSQSPENTKKKSKKLKRPEKVKKS